ncbi:single-stranded DNA-binding protein [Arthrobacter sp. efr-133-R2A-63]|uniref:single-stranded DNA-binding protein n=1 Tax=Arthrobacter sp. efr-133-R2A-63 TaxID=3040278 RepID=UPI00254E72F1|nr:single-stranded DNA-binding protein [Arthrobacter sp. efr-133-R2A-63]
MAGETFITVIGKVHEVTDPKYMDDGSAVTKVTVIGNPRKFNRQKNEWENKPGKFWDCRAWNQGKMLLADNVSNTLKKGDNVILYGELETREWEIEGGQKRRADQLRIETIGKDLRWHQAPANDVPAAAPADQGWGAAPDTSGSWGNQPQTSQPGWG